MAVSALRQHPEIEPMAEQFSRLAPEQASGITQMVLKLLPAELRDTYLAMRPYRARPVAPIDAPVQGSHITRGSAQEMTEARKNYINRTSNEHNLGYSKITYFKHDDVVQPKDLLELPEYAYSDYKLVDIIRKPYRVDFTKTEEVISQMIYKREFWAKEMEEFSRRVMETFEQ